jgi:hypothetical protein
MHAVIYEESELTVGANDCCLLLLGGDHAGLVRLTVPAPDTRQNKDRGAMAIGKRKL